MHHSLKTSSGYTNTCTTTKARFQVQSSHSQPGVGSTNTLSMREKSHMKRRVNKEHNSNFRAGYININEEYLHKTGIRGRKRYFLYCFVGFLVFLALLNALVTAWLVYKFRIYHIGMKPMEFVSDNNMLRFLEESEVRVIKMSNARLGGRFEKDLYVVSKNSTMLIGAENMRGSVLKLKKGLTRISSDYFIVKGKNSSVNLLQTGYEGMEVPLKHAKNLHALTVQVGKLRSREGYQDIVFESQKQIKVVGSEGVQVESGKSVFVEPSNSVNLNASDGSIHFDFGSNIYLNQSLPRLSPGYQIDTNLIIYKLCVCLDSGRVFRVPITGPSSGCNTLNENQNPCDL
ncbi:beta-sarcoglycan-like isoform X1 [Haliotis cracherodii]|uniref:beta-sarcoglycan-like isoform X1 n=1 Tax=Haliotis cracherodii TaxID=6455 RepID=UPI0039E8E461